MLPDAQIKTKALDAAHALLTLSDALAKRANVHRGAHRGDRPGEPISLPRTEQLKRYAKRVRFTDAELEKLGISRIALAPFFLQSGHYDEIAHLRPGDSPLELHPLIPIEGGILIAHPGVMSVAIRAVLLSTVKAGGIHTSFVSWLAVRQEASANPRRRGPAPCRP